MSGGRIINPAVPNLPLGTQEYERRYQDQFTNILRLYFNQLRNAMSELFSSDGGKYISFPYGAFQDSTDQVAVSTTVAYPVTFDTTDFSNGVTVASNSRITVANAGLWNLQFSIQLTNTTSATHDVDIWFRVNGTNVPRLKQPFWFGPKKKCR
jgi:peptidoglycan/xylan/chitin deacetylase (PgdA/CDA1 family)